MPKPAEPRTPAPQEFIDHPDELLQAILKAVGTLKPGERLELRRVRDPNYERARSATKKSAKRKAGKSKSSRGARRTADEPKSRHGAKPIADAPTSRRNGTRKALRAVQAPKSSSGAKRMADAPRSRRPRKVAP